MHSSNNIPDHSTATQIQASCVAYGDHALLILGESASGKSDLALQLIDDGGMLVADDRVDIAYDAENGQLFASSPENLRGLIELRHVGLMQIPASDEPVTISGAVCLYPAFTALERMPEPKYHSILSHAVPLLELRAFERSNSAKIRLWMQAMNERNPSVTLQNDTLHLGIPKYKPSLENS